MGEFSLMHWLIVGVIALVFFGPSKLPGLAKGLGEAIRGFKKGLEEGETEKKPEQLAASEDDKDKKAHPENRKSEPPG